MFYNYRFLIYGFLGLLFAFCFGLFYVALNSGENTSDFERNAKKLNGIFYIKENKVYAAVPSNGYYEVKEANPETFAVFPDTFNDAHIGFDDQHVYAGNMILKGLKPQGLQALGNNYYTDGETTYYCNRNSERNESLGMITFLFQLIGHEIGWTDKPQNYWYPFLELPKNKSYQSKLNYAIAVNDQEGFYKGLPMKDADPKNLINLNIQYSDRQARESVDYLTDGKRVYYQNQLLSATFDTEMFEVGIEGDLPSRNQYLMDPARGQVFVDGLEFDRSKAPYRLLGQNLEHANQALFAAKDGIYFYNAEKEEVERAGKNPFVQSQFEEIAPDVFRSGKAVYYLKAIENWSNKRGLRGRKTMVARLENVDAADLKKVPQENLRSGEIWQANDRYFYFDDLGSGQLMSSAIYEIKDLATLQNMRSSDLRTDDFRKLRNSGQLKEPQHEATLTAVTKYPDEDVKIVYYFIGGIAGLFLLGTLLLRNKKIAPFIIKEDQLIMNNLLFKKYQINNIQEVVFSVVAPGGRVRSYRGKMKVVAKNGRSGRNFLFSSKISLISESELEIIAYIHTLQDDLRKVGIKSSLK